MKRDRIAEWWDTQPAGDYTCLDCGKVGPKAYVQLQHPTTWGRHDKPEPHALCGDCIGRRNARINAERKAQLAALPRCAVPDCLVRATLTHNGTGICGRHYKRARSTIERRAGPLAGLYLFGAPVRLSRDGLVAAATGGT